MQTAVLLAILAAAAVSADQPQYVETCKKEEYKKEPACEVKPAPVYKEELPVYRHYDCDATSKTCYAPATYGDAYKPEGYSYGKHYDYPGPKVRLCNKLRKIKKGAVGVVKGVFHAIGAVVGAAVGLIVHVWNTFAKKWNKWCGEIKSDWERFLDWKKCKDEAWKDWWAYYLDLCRTRKALWDDAMREFHRQWHHYKKCAKAGYEDKKKECKVKEADYDDHPDYPKNSNYLGVTPVEISYKPIPEYKPEEYKKTCEKKDAEYKKTYGNAPADVPDPTYSEK